MENFYQPYNPKENYEDSRLERVGVWITDILDKTHEIRVVSNTKRENGMQHFLSNHGFLAKEPELQADFVLKEDGTIQRQDNSNHNREFAAKRFCPHEIVVKYEGAAPNAEQSLTITDLVSYARVTGKKLTVTGKPLIPWLLPTGRAEGEGKFQPYQFDVTRKEGIALSLLPEGLLTPTPVAKALREAERRMGRNIDVTSATRSFARQLAILKEMRAKPLAEQTAVAAPGQSNHDLVNGGNSIDVDNWKQAKKYLEAEGIVQGDPGTGPIPRDPWHFTFVGQKK